ncbi:MAG: class I SAM-dependent methyltransferase [Ignavibacteriales bacterium]|nr:MAG: class I SAM-dependent methyltransferase [Ignavibacteriales bacterium]
MIAYKTIIQSVNSFYDNIGPLYDIIYPNYEKIEAGLIKSLSQKKIINNNQKILDVGCGSGYFLRELEKLNNNLVLTGLDISKKSIANAIILTKKESKIRYKKEDIIEYNGDKFDVIVCLGNTLIHYPLLYQKKILNKLYTLLNSSGLLLIDIYKDWQKYFSDIKRFEPKGYKTNKLTYFSFIYTIGSKHYIKRNVCFAKYKNKKKQEMPFEFKQYVIKQYPFILDRNRRGLSFKDIEEVELEDKLKLYKYFMLKK